MFCLLLEVFIPQGLFSMYKQGSYLPSMSFYRDRACIPHQSEIATMRNDMVDYRCRNVSSLLQTTNTHRVLAEILFTEPTPFAVVTTLCS